VRLDRAPDCADSITASASVFIVAATQSVLVVDNGGNLRTMMMHGFAIEGLTRVKLQQSIS
jgi:hypothetical protein